MGGTVYRGEAVPAKLVEITGERDYRPDWREAGDRPEAPGDLPGTESPSLVELMRMTREEWDWVNRLIEGTGMTARGLVNRLIREVGPMSPEAPQFPLAANAAAPPASASTKPLFSSNADSPNGNVKYT